VHLKLSLQNSDVASANDIADLQDALRGKSQEEIITYLQDRYGSENVQIIPPLSLLEEVPAVTGRAVGDVPEELMRRLIDKGFNKLPEIGKSDVMRWLRRGVGDKKAGCLKLFQERSVFGKYSGRLAQKGKIDRPTFTQRGGRGAEVVSQRDAGIAFDLIEVMLDFFQCRGPPPPPPPIFIDRRVPGYTKAKGYLDQENYRQEYEKFRLPHPVGPEFIPVTESGMGLIPTLVAITAGAVILFFLITVCGPMIIAVAAVAKTAFLALLTKEAVTVGGTAVLLGMLSLQGGAQTPLTLDHIQRVQRDIDTSRYRGPSYFEGIYAPSNCGDPSQAEDEFTIPLPALTGNYQLPPIFCAAEPDALQERAFVGTLPLVDFYKIVFFIGIG